MQEVFIIRKIHVKTLPNYSKKKRMIYIGLLIMNINDKTYCKMQRV